MTALDCVLTAAELRPRKRGVAAIGGLKPDAPEAQKESEADKAPPSPSSRKLAA